MQTTFALCFFSHILYHKNNGKGVKMAIGFARLEYVKRSEGKNSVAKSAYSSKSKMEFEGNVLMSPVVYDWSNEEKTPHHEVLLPKGVHEKFKDPSILWNAAEDAEKRINSQTAIDFVLALPDDKVITLEDRIEIARTFFQAHFVDHGLAVQMDIHSPEKKIQITRRLGYLKILGGVF